MSLSVNDLLGIKMRNLTLQEIELLISHPGRKRMAVENFLMSMGTNNLIAKANLELDAKLYKWNSATIHAIRAGIKLASKGIRIQIER